LTSPDRAVAGAERAPGAVFALLVAACFAAFFVTQRLKHTPTLVQRFELTPFFSPTSAGHLRLEAISFKLAHTEQVTVTIVDATGGDVATLVRNRLLTRYKQFSLRWNGRLGAPRGFSFLSTTSGRTVLLPANHGRLAPAGEYRVRVSLRDRRRAVLSPRSFTLVRR